MRQAHRIIQKAGIHIICLDNPGLPTYGGVIDIHYRLLALASAGVSLYVHAFYTGREKPDKSVLLQIAEEVHFYPRKSFPACVLDSQPYMVCSRNHPDLIKRLIQDNLPVWCEGIHTSAVLTELRKQNPERKFYLRAHNVESLYYQELFRNARNPVRRLYFKTEYLKILKYEENILREFDHVFAISPEESLILQKYTSRISWLPAFVRYRNQVLKTLPNPDPDDFNLLFHGNFAIDENRISAEWLIHFMQKFPRKGMRLLLAGKKLGAFSASLPASVQKFPDPEIMDEMLDQADLIVLPGTQRSGVKIKLLESLSAGKRVICSMQTASGSGLESELVIFKNEEQLNSLIEKTLSGEFDAAFLKSIHAFQQLYAPEKGVKMISDIVFP